MCLIIVETQIVKLVLFYKKKIITVSGHLYMGEGKGLHRTGSFWCRRYGTKTLASTFFAPNRHKPGSAPA